MLIYGLQGFQGTRILILVRPAFQLGRDLLAERCDLFRKAG